MRHAIIPIRDFAGMTRLSPVLGRTQRRTLSIELAELAITASSEAELAVTVVTADGDVAQWATDRGVTVTVDPGKGLSSAVAGAIASLTTDTWLVLHADLPAVDAESVGLVAGTADRAGAAIAPSLDGGTNAIAAQGDFPFAFGPGSFHRHLARRPDAAVVVDSRLALEVDTPAHAKAIATLGLLPSLST
jgi:2-phospho-L-lactate guanylyltransferase